MISSDVINIKFSSNNIPTIGSLLTTKNGTVLSIEAIKNDLDLLSNFVSRNELALITKIVNDFDDSWSNEYWTLYILISWLKIHS